MSVRRSTRKSAKTNGFRHSLLSYTPTKKKPRCSRKLNDETSMEGQEQSNKTDQDMPVTPYTPIPVLQHVGMMLQIPEAELTEDKLEAGPEQDMAKKNSDD